MMRNQGNKKLSVQNAKEAAQTVARLGEQLPSEIVQKMYDEVIFDLIMNTKLADKMKSKKTSIVSMKSIHDVKGGTDK